MPLAITARPTHWDAIVGQDRVIQTLSSILRYGRFAPRGFIMEGPHGVGKTTTARVLARALMCIGDNPLGCGTCASCLVFDEHPDQHPDFKEVDAASYPSVTHARTIMEEAQEMPSVGKLRVVLIDEAHRMSREAWDVYLKPLEQTSVPAVFLFSTTAGGKIPSTVRSRCCPVKFSKVAADTITGLLVSLAGKNDLDYELEGVRLIARAARGHVRDGVLLLDKVASLGRITKPLVLSVVDLSLMDQALNAWIHLALDRKDEAFKAMEDISLQETPAAVIQSMFSVYGRAVLGDREATVEEAKRLQVVKEHFYDYEKVTTALLKWTGAERIPVDALPLFAMELHTLRSGADTISRVSSAQPPSKPTSLEFKSSPSPSLSARSVAKLLGGQLVEKG